MRFTDFNGLKIPQLALGTWAMGAGKDWGSADETDCLNAVSAALDCGVNLIDTAPIYGNYRAEEILGKALKSRRDKVLICTKCGLQPAKRAVRFDLSAKSVRQEVEASLKRLKTDYIDIYLIHWPDRNTPFEETFCEFENLKKQGKIRFYGACNLSPEQLKYAKQISSLKFVQNEFSLLKKTNQPQADFCLKNNLAFMAYGALGGGILSGKYKKEPCLPRCSVKSFFYKFYKGEEFKKSCLAAELLADIAQKYKATPAQAALNYALFKSRAATVLFGARSAAQVLENAAAANWQFTDEDAEYINERYF